MKLSGAPPRLVATDLDGTLLRSDRTVSVRTRETIAAVTDAGVPFVMVTGRSPRSMADIAEATGHRGTAVCANGAVRYDMHTEQVVHQHLLDPALAAEAVLALRAVLPDLVFAAELAGGGFGHEPGYVPSRPWPAPPRDVVELVSGGAITVLGHHPHLDPDALLAVALRTVGDRISVTASSTRSFVELNAPGVDKATGLASLAGELGIDAADVIAFGDMPNDVPMLAWAGRAVGVAAAHAAVLALVDEVTCGNDDDGVAVVLERWFAPGGHPDYRRTGVDQRRVGGGRAGR